MKMPRPDNVAVGVAAIVIRKRKILLLKRKGAHAANKWAVPGGWVDRSDQTVPWAVRREVLQETGMESGSVRLYDVTTEDSEELGCRTVTIYYQVDTFNNPEIQEPDKCSSMRWFSYLETLNLDLFPGLANVIFQLHHDGDI